MERSAYHEVYSRRAVIGALLGGTVAVLSRAESASPAPSPETNGGGTLCVEPPNEAGVQELETIHEEASDNEIIVDHYEVADRYGLTLAPREEVARVHDELEKFQTSLEAVEFLSAFTLEHLGIPVYLDREIIETPTYRSIGYPLVPVADLQRLLKNLALLPVEFYKAINLSHILIEDLPPKIGGDYDMYTGRARLDSRCVGDTSVLYHELSHALHLTGCGSFEDAAMSGTLPDGIEYTGEGENSILPEGIFVIPYGQKDYKEDFATTAAAWMAGVIGLSDELEGTPVYEKLAIVMDWFETFVPGMVQYIEEGVRQVFLRQA